MTERFFKCFVCAYKYNVLHVRCAYKLECKDSCSSNTMSHVFTQQNLASAADLLNLNFENQLERD